MTASQVATVALIIYLFIGICWVIRNHFSRMAQQDRQQWRHEGKLWKFVVVPVVVALIWPFAFWLLWRLKKAVRTGEFERVTKEVVAEYKAEGKIKNGHIVGMHNDPQESEG